MRDFQAKSGVSVCTGFVFCGACRPTCYCRLSGLRLENNTGYVPTSKRKNTGEELP